MKCTSDTVVYYNIEELSSEGAEAEVLYTFAGDISSVKIRIYGCSGQVRIEMTLDKSQIKVKEKTYFYEKPLSEIESEEDIHLKSELEYTMDYNGNLLNKKPDLDHIDIFPVFRKVIPFKINRNTMIYQDQLLARIIIYGENKKVSKALDGLKLHP